MVSVYVKEMRTVLSSDLSGLLNTVTKLCSMVYSFSTKNEQTRNKEFKQFSTIIADIINFMI